VNVKYPDPHLIEFPKLGNSTIGFISVMEGANHLVPFDVKRVFWTYFTPEDITRGRHAHKQTEQVLIAVAGVIHVMTETADGIVQEFRLDRPNVGVYIPPHVWHVMHYSHTSVQMVFASTEYAEADYLRDKAQFQTYWGAISAEALPTSGL
jgi:hypothetical protein